MRRTAIALGIDIVLFAVLLAAAPGCGYYRRAEEREWADKPVLASAGAVARGDLAPDRAAPGV